MFKLRKIISTLVMVSLLSGLLLALYSTAIAEERQERMKEKELLERARKAVAEAGPAEVSIRVDYTVKDNEVYITLPEHLGGGKKTAILNGKLSLLFKISTKDPNIASLSVVGAEEKISSIDFVYNGTKVETGEIIFTLDAFDQRATKGKVNFKTGEIQMTYVLLPRVPFLEKQGIRLFQRGEKVVNKEKGKISPTTLAIKTETRISIKSGFAAGTEIYGDEEDVPHTPPPPGPICRVMYITLDTDYPNCGQYSGTVSSIWGPAPNPICGLGVNNTSSYRIKVSHLEEGGPYMGIEGGMAGPADHHNGL